MWDLKKNDTNELTYKIERDRLRKQIMVAWGLGGRCREGIVREFLKVMYTQPYSKWIINKDLLYITWNYTQRYVAAWMGGENGHMYMYG